MIRDAIVAALYGMAKVLSYLGDWLAREDDEVWRDRVRAEALCRFEGVVRDGFVLTYLEGGQLEYVDPTCMDCDGSCGVCHALELPERPGCNPLTDQASWTLRGNAFHAGLDAD